MKHNGPTRFLSVLLAALLIAATAIPAAFATANDGNCPIVVVHGAGATLQRTAEDGSEIELYGDGEYISDLISQAIPSIAKGILTGEWEEYTDIVLDVVLPAYEGFAPEKDGTLPAGSHLDWEQTPVAARASYGINNAFHFAPDVRKDPTVVADELNAYIERIKAVTGYDKVAMVTRCEGAGYALAYLTEYGHGSIESLCMCDPSLGGLEYLEALFSGTVKIPGDAALRYLMSLSMEDNDPQTKGVEDEFDAGLLAQISELLKETYSINLTASVANRMYSQLKDTLIAEILRAYYARIPGNWICVREQFDEAIDYVFPTAALKAEYAYIIGVARSYHDNILLHAEETLKAAQADGIDVSIVAEYGYQQYPLSEACEYVGDILCGVSRKTLGATASKVEETLSSAYISGRIAKGLAQYISPDKQIDASTCLFPDTTWFIKNINHASPDQSYVLVEEIVRHPGYTVLTDPAYPQYLNYVADSPVLVPLQEKNANDVDWGWHGPTIIIELIKKALDFISDLFAKITGFIDGIAGKAQAVVQ